MTEPKPRRELQTAKQTRPGVTAAPQHAVKGGTCIDVDEDDGTSTWFMGEDTADCPRCPGPALQRHDFYLEASGDTVIVGQMMKVCARCFLETPVSHQVEIGRVDAPTTAVQNRAARRAAAAAARRGK